MDRADRPQRRGVREAGRDLWVRLRTEGSSPGRQAAAVALGVAIGCLPLYGTHLVLCFGLAGWLGLNRINTYLAAHVNNPVTAPFLLTGAFLAGHRFLHGTWPTTRPELTAAALWELGRETLVGSVLLGLLLAPLAGALAWSLARRRGDDAFDQLAERVAARYRSSGIAHWEFARGKLRGDPLYREVLARLDGLGKEGTVVDLGCGRGLALALLAGRHDGKLFGVERRAKLVDVARRALGPEAAIAQLDLMEWEPIAARAILLLDVLHYLTAREQELVIRRVADALEEDGLLLLREADRAGGARFVATRLAERLASLARGAWRQGFAYRSASEWAGLLAAAGLVTDIVPLSAGTPFANSLLVARRRPTPASSR